MEEPTRNRLVAELVRIRRRKRIGQDTVAQRIGISQSRLSRIERLHTGVSLKLLVAYALAIEATIDVVSRDRTAN